MKTKTFAKRLSLNKKTVANLFPKEMNDAKGGVSIYTDCTCPPPTELSCNTQCVAHWTLCICIT